MILIRGLSAPFITLMLVCGILVYYFAAYSREQVETKLVRIASDHSQLIDQFLEERALDLQFAASFCSIKEISKQERLRLLFRNLISRSRAFFDLGVFDENGNHLAYVGPYDLAGKNYADTVWFKAVEHTGRYISDVFLGYRNIPHFIIAIRRDEGDRTWYLRATMDTLFFNDLVENIRVGKSGEAYLVNRKGILQTKRRSGGSLMEPDVDYGFYQIDNDRSVSFFTGKHSNRRYLYAVSCLKQTGWILVMKQEVSDAFAPLTRAVLVAVILIVIGGAVAVTMAYILASGLANRLTLADIEKRQMKTQLVMAGKFAEIGEMSTALAHEINNPLQVMKAEHMLIQELISDVEKSTPSPDPEPIRMIKDSVEQIDIQIERCKRITQGLLNFARKTDAVMKPVKMQEFLPEMVRMVEQKALVENVRIIQKLDPDMTAIISEPNQLQQVFLNLLNNAIYALKGRDSAEIRINVFREDAFINVSIADNGCGIPPENMEKIFLPFFTTKPPGQGTGLGLSTVYGIVKGLGGDITVTSELNTGSVFNVRLPLKPAEKEENKH
ncbi:MAG: GHKL domain-containing protein [Deltaproteobacteria bacterium]|nr:GHKL domain-containing protein [Deltaproteobacteria bacterium]MBW1960041.1 GHKL domain-containing protein [Deltaproteobacteria bacterium]MBW2151233.1 GHKL domain-containing protein [Deltaproteobacteria bacterium]